MGIGTTFKYVQTLWHHRRILALLSIFVLGLLLIFLAAFLLSGVPLVIALMIGGVLVIISWVKMTFNTAVKREVQLKDAEKPREENRQLREGQSILEQQLEVMRGRKLQLLNVQPILELGILEADCQITECFDLLIDKQGNIVTEDSCKEPKGIISAFWDGILEGWFGKGRTRFIGTLKLKFPARYGISLQNLKIRRDDIGKIVYVGGAEPTYQCLGKTFPQTSWEGCIVLREQWDGNWSTEDAAIAIESPLKDACRKSMEDSLKNGPEDLEWLKQPLQNTIRHLLQMMIVPQGYSLELVDEIEGESKSFFEYAAELGLEKPRLEGNF
jgi:hypothetical protein